jgi:hypothetical protein
MGWSFRYGATKQDVIRDLIRDGSHDDANGSPVVGKTLAHCVRGNILWYVKEYTDKDKAERFIGCSILGVDKGCGWGSKDMEESSGPCYYTCPLSYLDMVPDPGGYAGAWRVSVREYWQKRRHARARVRVGDTIKLGQGFSVGGIKQPTMQIVSMRPMRASMDGIKVRLNHRALASAEVVTA